MGHGEYVTNEIGTETGCAILYFRQSKSNVCVNEEVDSLEIVPIYLAICCKVHKAYFIGFPSKSADKARVVFNLYLGVRSKLNKRTIASCVIHCEALRTLTLK